MKFTSLIALLVTLLILTASALHCNVCPNQAKSACSYVETTGVKAFPSSQLTFEGWIFFGAGHSAGLMEYISQNSLGQNNRALAIAATSTAIHVTVQDNVAIVPLPSHHAQPLNTREWNHIAVTWDVTKATLQVFINGLPATDSSSQLSASANLFMQSGGNLRFGRYNDTLALSSSGSVLSLNLLQEIRLWTTALDERTIVQTLIKMSNPSYTGIFGHWRLWGNATTDLYDLAQGSTGNDRSLTLVGDCFSDTELESSVLQTKRPGSYELMSYTFVPLLGLGMASGKQYALDLGNEIQISSFGDGNVVECSNGQKVIMTNQGTATIGNIKDGDSIIGVMGVQGVGTRDPPQMPMIPRSFQGTKFTLPNIRGATLFLTVKSLSNDLSEAEADAASSELSAETIRVKTNGMRSTSMYKASKKCTQSVPIAITGSDDIAGNYRLAKAMDNDPDSWWRKSQSNRQWLLQAEFATPTIIDQYSFAVSTQWRTKNYYPKTWKLYGSDDGINYDDTNLIGQETDVTDWEYEEKRSFWASDGTTRPRAYKHWMLQFTAVYNGGTLLQIGEIELKTCGSDMAIQSVSSGINGNMDADNPIMMTLDKEDVLSFATTRSSLSSPSSPSNDVMIAVDGGSDSWAFTEAWKCTNVEPPWYWILPEFIDTDDMVWTKPDIVKDEELGTITLTALDSAAAGAQQWCRSALANQPDVLTLWDSRYGTKITRLLPKGGVTQFQITGYHRNYFHVLTSSSLALVVSRADDYDARPVPAGGKKIVGFRSAQSYTTPLYSGTTLDGKRND